MSRLGDLQVDAGIDVRILQSARMPGPPPFPSPFVPTMS